jgi:hypothetical protein
MTCRATSARPYTPVFHLVLEMNTEAFLGEVLLLTPISVSISLTAGLVTIAADDFTDFTMGYYLELIIGMIEYVYLVGRCRWTLSNPHWKHLDLSSLKLEQEKLVSNFPFKLNLRRYNLDSFINFVTVRVMPRVKMAMQRAFRRLRRRTISEQLLEGAVAEEDSVAGRSLITSTALTLNRLLLLRPLLLLRLLRLLRLLLLQAYVWTFTLKLSHAPISVECMFSMTLPRGGGPHGLPHRVWHHHCGPVHDAVLPVLLLGLQRSGRGVTENKHSTDVESTSRVLNPKP